MYAPTPFQRILWSVRSWARPSWGIRRNQFFQESARSCFLLLLERQEQLWGAESAGCGSVYFWGTTEMEGHLECPRCHHPLRPDLCTLSYCRPYKNKPRGKGKVRGPEVWHHPYQASWSLPPVVGREVVLVALVNLKLGRGGPEKQARPPRVVGRRWGQTARVCVHTWPGVDGNHIRA